MLFEGAPLTELLNLKFNPDILSEEETKLCFEEEGVNVNEVEEMFSCFETKLVQYEEKNAADSNFFLTGRI